MANDLFSKILKLRLSSKSEIPSHCSDLKVATSECVEPSLEECADILRPPKSRRKHASTWNHRNISKLFSKKSKNKYDRSFDSNINSNNGKESWSEHLNTISLGSKTPMASPMVYPKKSFMHFFGRKRNPSKLSQIENMLKLNTSDNIVSNASISSKSCIHEENNTQISFETPDRVSDSGKGTGSEGELVPPFSLQKYQLNYEMDVENEQHESPSAKLMRLEFFNGTYSNANQSTGIKDFESKIKIVQPNYQTSNATNNYTDSSIPKCQKYNQNKISENVANAININAKEPIMSYSILIQSPDNMSLSLTSVSSINNSKPPISSISVDKPQVLEVKINSEKDVLESSRPNTLEFKNSPGFNIPSNVTTLSGDSDDMILDFSLGPENELEELKIEQPTESCIQKSLEEVPNSYDTITVNKAAYQDLLNEIAHLKSQIHHLISIISFDRNESSPIQ